MRNIKPIIDPSRPKVYIETYGCQMNVNDSEVILSILQDEGYALTESMDEADVILANTCSSYNRYSGMYGRKAQGQASRGGGPCGGT